MTELSPPPKKRRVPPLMLFALVACVTLFVFLARKVGAQEPAPKGKNDRAGLRVAGHVIPSAAPAPPPTADGGDAPAPSATYEEPVDYAKTGPEGGVPVHNEGQFKSPFAHPKFGGPAIVKVGILLTNVRNYDIQKGTFDADFFLTFTSDKAMPPMDPIFTNGKVDQKEVMADKPTFKMYRFLGNFSSPLDLHDYPFDTQELSIEIEDDDNGTDQIRLVADQEHTNLDVGFEVSGWSVSSLDARVLDHYFPDRFEHDDMYYSRYIFKLGVARFGTSAIFTVFIPAIVIVLISLSGIWYPREELEVRSNATTPMLAAAVLFHFALIQSLPATAYLTRADKLMMAVYAILGLHMLLTWLWFVFDEKHTLRIMSLGKWIGVPVTFAVLGAGMFL